MPRPSSPVYAKASTNCPYLTLENPHHHRQRCLHDSGRHNGGLVLLIRTDSTFVRTTQLDNHYVANDARARMLECRPRHRFLEPIYNVKDEALRPLPRRTADPVYLHLWKRLDGGAYRDRTDDLKLAKLALSQLS